MWTCPITNLQVPKGRTENLQWRKSILEEAEKDSGLRQALADACKLSVLFWANAFAWTFRVREVGEDGKSKPVESSQRHTPFITWPVQDVVLTELCDAVREGRDAIIDKSRDMGASWMCCLALHWHWQFKRDFQGAVMSRVEEDVDKPGNRKTLFYKHDYLNEYQPSWLLPRISRKYMHLGNETMGSNIDGTSTNQHAGRGDRRDAILLDEFASVQNGDAILGATADVTNCRLFNSTPIAGSAFSRLRRDAESKSIKIITLGYWDHPEKGRGRRWKVDEDGSITGKPGTGYWKTPWLMRELERRTSRSEVAAEIFIDHDTAGAMYFDSVVVTHARQGVCPPSALGRLSDGEWIDDRNGQWKLWCELHEHNRRGVSIYEPSQNTNYVLGIDFSQGTGKSNTVIYVMDAETGEYVAEYADPNIAAFEVAPLAIEAGRFFGGQSGNALIVWEVTGPGQGFTRAIKTLGYPMLYRQRPVGKKREQRTESMGWTNNAKSKEDLFAEFHRALARGDITIHSEELIQELGDYLVDDRGRIVAAERADDTSGAVARHGDRVIAAALCQLGRLEAPRFMRSKPVLPKNSIGKLLGFDEEGEPRESAQPFSNYQKRTSR